VLGRGAVVARAHIRLERVLQGRCRETGMAAEASAYTATAGVSRPIDMPNPHCIHTWHIFKLEASFI
jgi:hypothetical protein